MLFINNEKLLEFAKFFHDGIISAPYALGIKLTLAALDYLKIDRPKIKDLFVISETRHCFIDGIQVVAKTTFGCGDLVIKDFGKLAFVMVNNKTGKSIRVSIKPEFQIKMTEFSNKIRNLFETNNRKKILELTGDFGKEILEMDSKDICFIKKIRIIDNSIIENAAHKHKEFICENCGESILEYAVIEVNNKTLCPFCSGREKYYKII